MSDNELLIKINADAKNVTKAYEDVKSETENLEESLHELAKISGVAFAALTAQVAVSVHAFAEAQTASIELTNALQNQGIYTDKLKESYKAYAEQVSEITGVENDEIIKAQAVAQTFLGRIPVTKQLTQAIVDLAHAQGISLTSAAEQMGKAIADGNGMLLRQGLQFSATSTEAERYTQTLDFVTTKFGGAANAVAPLEMATRRLKTAFNESQQELGERFEPAVTAAINALTDFIKPSKDASGAMTDLKAVLISMGLVITGLGVALPVLAQAFLTVRAALIAMNTQLTVTQALLAGLGIGLVSIAITELVLHFNQLKGVVQALIADFKELGNVAGGVGKVFLGIILHDGEKLKEGLLEIGNAFKKIGTDAAEGWKKASEETNKGATEQIQAKKELAEKLQAQKNAEEAARAALAKAERELVRAEIQNQSAEVIELKKQEIEVLKQLTQKQNAENRALLKQRYAQIKADEKIQATEEIQIQKEFDKEQEEAAKEHGIKKDVIRTAADKKEIENIRKNTETQEKAKKKVFEDDLKYEQAQHNRFLEEQIKYGTAYAAVNEAMHSTVYQGTKSAFGDLAELQQSSNSTLKSIGKVAAIANIVIKTAESAMNIYAGFSTIPIIGPALGIAGAAAAVAFGAEQVGKVSAAKTGGIVGGVGYGDTQPFILEPGELITPRQNFNEVIDAVAAARGYSKDSEPSPASDQNVKVMIGFDGRQAQQVLTAEQVKARSIGTYRAVT